MFTSAVVQGLLTGDADHDEDGLIALGELYDYVFDRVREQNPQQTPGRDVEMSGEVYLARSRRQRLRAVPVPDAVAAALREPDPTYRRGAVMELRDRLGHSDLGVALGAFEALQSVARGDIRAVSDDATAIISSVAPRVQPETINFGAFEPGDRVTLERTLQVIGVPLARAVHVDAAPPLSATVEGDTITVTFSPGGRSFAGTVTVGGVTGSVSVAVTAQLRTSQPALGWSHEADPDPASPSVEALDVASDGGPGPVPERVSTSTSDSTAEPPPEPPHHLDEVLVGRRIVPSSDAPKAADEASRTASSNTREAPSLDSLRERSAVVRALGWLVLGSGLLVVVSLFLPWVAGDSSTNRESNDVAVALIVGALMVASGVTLVSRVVEVAAAAGLAAATAATAVPSLVKLFGPNENGDFPAPGTGWYAAAAAGVLVLGGCSTAVALLGARVRLHLGPFAWRDPGTLVGLGAATLAVVLFANYARYLGEVGADFWQNLGYLWVILSIAVPLVGLALRPRPAGRGLLAGWGVATLAFCVPEWILLVNHDLTPEGMPILVLMGVTMIAAALFVGRRDERGRASSA